MKHNWKPILAGAAAVVLLLAAAFCFGGTAPDAPEQSALPSQSPAQEAPSPSPAGGLPSPAPSTEPDPSPAPDRPSAPAVSPEPGESDPGLTCTLSISCAALLEHMDRLEEAKHPLVPEDGWLLPPTTVSFSEGESVFDVLRRTCREQGLHMEYEDTPLYHSAYIEGIGNLYEFDCGSLSGWKYKVNGEFPNYGCSRCLLQKGDRVEWVYTCDSGEDAEATAGGTADETP